MNWLVLLAVALLVLWLLAEAVGFVLGAALNLLWIGALVLFVIWMVQKVRGRA
jgi:hypothetical protein